MWRNGFWLFQQTARQREPLAFQRLDRKGFKLSANVGTDTSTECVALRLFLLRLSVLHFCDLSSISLPSGNLCWRLEQQMMQGSS